MAEETKEQLITRLQEETAKNLALQKKVEDMDPPDLTKKDVDFAKLVLSVPECQYHHLEQSKLSRGEIALRLERLNQKGFLNMRGGGAYPLIYFIEPKGIAWLERKGAI